MRIQYAIKSHMKTYCIASDLALELFKDEAVVLLARKKSLITLDKPAAGLLTLIKETFSSKSFSLLNLRELLTQHYDLTANKAEKEIRKILASWLEYGIISRYNFSAES